MIVRAGAGPSARRRAAVGLRWRALATACLAMALLSGCAAPRPVDSVVLGGTLPLSGRDAPLGEAMARGYRRAVVEFNEAGGVRLTEARRRVEVRLDLRDDQADAARSEALARTLFEQGAHVLLSTSTGVRAVVQAVVAERAQRPHVVNPIEAAGLSTGHSRWTFIVEADGPDPETRAHATARAALAAIERAGSVDPAMVRASLERR
jgi:hypothetical protein